MANKFGIGMSQKEAEDFWRELVLILIGVPFLIIVSIMIIDALLQDALGKGLGIFRYLLYGLGGLGWIVAIYKRYLEKIIKNI